MAPKATAGFSFEELEREMRRYLGSVTDARSVTRAVKEVQAAQARVEKVTKSITRASLVRAAKAGYEIYDGIVHEPEPAEGKPTKEPLISSAEDSIHKARSVQTKLLPSTVPKLPGLDIATFNRFCEQVGGDYYDFISLPRERIGFVIADVSGKGVPAAMVMVMFRSILRMVAAHDHGPVETMIYTNRLLVPDMLRGMFVTALYAVIDPNAREITLANAGHYPPLLWRPRLTGTRVINIRGPALGLLDAKRFAEGLSAKTLALESGDCLCFFTDGVPDAKNLLGEEFGEKGLARAFRDQAGQPSRKIIEAIVQAVDAHSEEAPQHDDITLVVLRAL